MRSKSNIPLVLALAAVCTVVTRAAVVRAQASLDRQKVAAFVADLQTRVAGGDRRAVAALMQFPLTVDAGPVRIPLADADALAQTYDVVFPPALREIVAHASMTASGPSAVRIVGDAAIIGDELMRIQAVGDALRITRIREPAATQSPSAAVKTPAAPRAPKRIALVVGQTQLSGALGPKDRDLYVIAAQKNQLLDVRINGVSGRDIVLHVIDAKTSAPVDQRAKDGVRVWTGRVPDEADYRIEVERTNPSGEPRLAYILVAALH